MLATIGAGIPFARKLPPLAELRALVRSLGGHIFAPGLETYADQAALNPAASALDSQVGYVGSAATQGLGENCIWDSEFTTATSSTLPTGWTATLTANGVTATQTGKGTDADGTYLEFTFSGTAGGTAATIFIFIGGVPASEQHPTAYPGQLWSSTCKIKGVSGTQFPLTQVIREIAGTTFGSFTLSSAVTVTNGAVSTLSATRRATDAGTTKVSTYIQVSVASGSGTWNQVIRIYAPQLERGHPTAYTPTYGTAISRGVFASAAQATLANTPKLVALGNARGLEFDGNTDYLALDVPTPSSGYVCVAFRQDEAIGGTNPLIGSGLTGYGAVTLFVRNDGTVGIRRANSASNQSIYTTAPITVGTIHIADASWGINDAKVRLNGGSSGEQTTTLDTTGSAIFLIGAHNSVSSGGVSPATGAYLQGAFGLSIIIPNVTLPAATEQRIRKLVGQIYGVQTQ